MKKISRVGRFFLDISQHKPVFKIVLQAPFYKFNVTQGEV